MGVNLFWHRDSVGNFGDDLNPWMAEKITGKKPKFVSHNSMEHKYMMIGSILGVAKNNTTVWGSGLMFNHGYVNPKAKFLAVRGRLSRDVVLKYGGKCPEVYGDPALLLPRFYKPETEKKYRLGVIPHYVDKSLITSGDSNTLMIDVGDPIEKFIDDVNSCQYIISSSLHGLIVADAYGIPSRWCEISNNVAGSGFKFADYFTSIGVDFYNPINLRGVDTIYSNMGDFVRPYDIKIDLDKLWDVCPIKGENNDG